ncbi:hypothetical protein CASFOL_031319 [Castilleja foliolosa]|uniref:Uncharacterized protein n=1 Tax=Castilleja foliolosa TaxID=1961234 RepID=A0ABD3C4E4_9LAMI
MRLKLGFLSHEFFEFNGESKMMLGVDDAGDGGADDWWRGVAAIGRFSARWRGGLADGDGVGCR